jgi:RNA polymerase sigma factor (TIGR02999 family)
MAASVVNVGMVGSTVQVEAPTIPGAAGPVTTWLARWRAGESEAIERLLPLMYDELRQVARRQLRRETPAHTLSATALVHEVYLRLLRQRQIGADDRNSFLAVVAQTMRRILVDHARRRKRLKRGGDLQPVPLDGNESLLLLDDREVDEVLMVERALGRLAELDARAARVVECRIFAGLTVEETAAALDTSVRTVQRTWTAALAWLRKEVAGQSPLTPH